MSLQVISIYIGGETCGAITQIILGDRLGRIRWMQFLSIVVTIGTIIQTASINIGMLIAGRFIAGFGVGYGPSVLSEFIMGSLTNHLGRGLIATVPIYLSEISAPKTRGLIGGISGLGVSSGTCLANYCGFALGYAPYGTLQWRLPLGLQIPWGIILFVGLATFMPNSPRQLIRSGKVDEARREFIKIRSDLHSHEVQSEFVLMRMQIEYEQQREMTSIREIWRLYRHRVLVYVGAADLPGPMLTILLDQLVYKF